MTNIALISNLPNESLRNTGQAIPDIQFNGRADFLIMAGNIDVQDHGVKYAVQQSQKLNLPVIYILGSQEYYGANSEPLYRKIEREIAGSDVHVLNTTSVVMSDVMFIGATLWTDFELFGSSSRNRVLSHAAFHLEDFYNIKLEHSLFSANLTPSISYEWHQRDKGFIQTSLAEDFAGKKVVITYHAPSMQCIPVTEQDNLLSACHASHLDELIEMYQPDAWFYGQNSPNQFQLGKTTIINNPVTSSTSLEAYTPLLMQI